MPLSEDVLRHCRETIRVGSKSFSLAGRLLGAQTRDAAFGLYAWCRTCDDAIDNTSSGLEAELARLIDKTNAVYAGAPMTEPAFAAFQHVVKTYAIPKEYPTELLEGMAMDTRGERYETFDDLVLYCYRVAGTVGLMMSHILGLSDEQALKNACDMGIAMQLTNIARDVREDFQNGRVYLPLSWLREKGVSVDKLMELENRPALYSLVERLLQKAESYYRSGDEGLRTLSFAGACSIAAARAVYSGIGEEIVKRGPAALDGRTVLTTTQKSARVLNGVVRILSSLPDRWRRPWRARPIQLIWRPRDLCRS